MIFILIKLMFNLPKLQALHSSFFAKLKCTDSKIDNFAAKVQKCFQAQSIEREKI